MFHKRKDEVMRKEGVGVKKTLSLHGFSIFFPQRKGKKEGTFCLTMVSLVC
jgi:hypothetical protein